MRSRSKSCVLYGAVNFLQVFAPALALSILDPKLSFSEEEVQAALRSDSKVLKADGNTLSTYDLKRLQVCPLPKIQSSCQLRMVIFHCSAFMGNAAGRGV